MRCALSHSRSLDARPRAAQLIRAAVPLCAQVLSSPEMRDNYDYLLDHPYEFPMHFMRFSRAKYVPKTDLRMVLIFTVLVLSTIQYFFLKSKYEISVKSIKASPGYQQQLKLLMAEEFKVGTKKSTGGSAKTKGDKANKADEAKKAAEARLEEEVAKQLQPPKYQDTLAWAVFVFPLTLYYSGGANLAWFVKYTVGRAAYDDEAKAYVTRKALEMPADEWAALSEAEQAELVSLELWVQENKAAYDEEEADAARAGGRSKNAKQKQEERAKKKRSGKLVMDD